MMSWSSAKTANSHTLHSQKVSTLLRDATVTLRLKKHSFFAENTNHLWPVIRPGCLEQPSATNAALREFKYSTTRTKLIFFLGIRNVLRRFVLHFSRLESLLIMYEKAQLDIPLSYSVQKGRSRKRISPTDRPADTSTLTRNCSVHGLYQRVRLPSKIDTVK